MKKNIFIICLTVLMSFITLFLFYKFGHFSSNENNDESSVAKSVEDSSKKLPEKSPNGSEELIEETPESPTETPIVDKNSVMYNGWLKTNGCKLENEKNEPIQLRGLSSHGIAWFSDVITYQNLEELKNNWNTNVFRIAMYTDCDGYGYIFSPEETINKVYKIIDMAVDLDMYVVIDWHILNDNNPQKYEEESKLFFQEISSKYSNTPNVIYEICNEPNGNDVTWDKNVKPYAEDLIPIIRNNSNKSLIIVGTPDWCKDLNTVADNPLNFENVVYSCHFYSGTHGSELREKIDYCIEKNIPVFVSECGLTDASGNGNVYFDEFKLWINYLNSKNISWIYWSFCNKNESSAVLLDTYVADNCTVTPDEPLNMDPEAFNISTSEKQPKSNYLNDYLTESGKFIKNILLSYDI